MKLLCAACLIVVTGGIAHGWKTHRWLPNTAIASAVARLDGVPDKIGRWVSESYEMSELHQEIGDIDGYVQREYRHLDTDARVHLLLVTGESGPISLHPPTACFSGRGFSIQGHQTIHTVADETADPSAKRHCLSQADFANTAVDDASLIRVYWGWSADGLWQSPDSPRMKFASEPVLYKIYVSERWFPQGDYEDDTGVAKRFLDDILASVKKAIGDSATIEGNQ